MQILLFIKNLFVKLLNFLFGKTKIFVIILGWFLIITGAIMLVFPEKARRKLLGMGFGQAKGLMLVLVLFLISLLFSFSSRIGSALSLSGIVVVVMGYFIFKKQVQEKLKEQLAKVPVKFLKVFACIQMAIGILMLILFRRIW